MRYLLLSDIHANTVALEAVLQHAKRQRWEQLIFLGDLIGYYTEPEAATTMLRELSPDIALLGNHDALLLELADQHKDHESQEDSLVSGIVRRHLAQLSEENLAFIRSFERHVVREAWEATHGALRKPWEYLSSLQNAQANMPLMSTNLCFVGHTHIPMVYACVMREEGELWRTMAFRGERAVYRLPPHAKVIFNPGSVGQPRDGMPLASYAVFDEEQGLIELYRVPFDLLKVQRQVRQHDYTEALATRLGVGR